MNENRFGRFQNKIQRYQPLIFSFASLLFLGFLISSFYFQNIETKEEAIRSDIESVTASLLGRIKGHVEFISLIADEYGENQLEKRFFIKKSDKFRTNHPELISISIVERENLRKWFFPESVDYIRSEAVIREPIENAIKESIVSEMAAYSKVYSSIQGETALAVAIPIVKDLEISGAIVAQINLERLFRSDIRNEYLERYRVELLDSDSRSLVNMFNFDMSLTNIVQKKAILNSENSPIVSLIRYQSPLNWLIISLSVACLFLVTGLALAIFTLSNDNRQKQLVQFELERAKNAAEQANKAKSQLIANISHEIRTPLGAIQGYLDLLYRFNLSNEEKNKTLKSIRRNTFNLLNIINDLLDMSKIEAGLLESEETEFNLIELILETVESVTFYSQNPNVSIETDIVTPIPEYIVSDQVKFGQILTNLLSNAIKFTKEGAIRVTVGFHNPKVSIEVSDTGIGMSEDQSKKIFRPFIQADTSISRKYGGTGLGLSLSQTFAEKLGGHLELAKSELNKGSTFKFSLTPRILENVSMINNLKEARNIEICGQDFKHINQLKGIVVLIVEDCRDNQIIYSRFLEGEGAKVLTASTGAQSLAISEEEKYDMAIMDIQMPEMDGYETTQSLRRMGITVPIVALTAHAMMGERERCLSAGCTDYITKPIDSETLVSKIRELLDIKDKISPDEGLKSKLHSNPRVSPLLYGFVSGISERISNMKMAISKNDRQELRILSHQLKGTSLNYGYPTISEASAKIESMMATDSVDIEQAAPIVDDIESYANRALIVLE